MLSLQASSLTVYKYTFIVALFVAEIMIFFRLAKRNRFPVRILLCLAGHLVLAWVYPISSYDALSSSLMFGCFFVVTVLLTKFCYGQIGRAHV